MSRTEKTPIVNRTVFVVLAALVIPVVVVVGLLLREYAPGNMGNGFLVGALIGLVGFGIALLRATVRPDSASVFERAFTRSGDERDDSVLTRALAVLGICALPLTGVAAILIAVGLDEAMVLALLLFAQLAIGAAAFVVINRRS